MKRSTPLLAAGLLGAALLLAETAFAGLGLPGLDEETSVFGVETCGNNHSCRIVDVLAREGVGGSYPVLYDNRYVDEAWNQLVRRGCHQGVTDVVVGGTGGEDGVPESSVPAGFAAHLMGNLRAREPARCTVVVNYEFEFAIDEPAYNASVEHGRKALAVVLNRLDEKRTEYEERTGAWLPALRVWGHSKGASIVESTWRMEARNGKSKFITRLIGRNHYVDACPSNRCYYFGFAYPRAQELNSDYSISHWTGTTWGPQTVGFIAKPATWHNEYWRLTTFTNQDDPIYTCGDIISCGWDLFWDSMSSTPCHEYEWFLGTFGYAYFDWWNKFGLFATDAEWVGNQCGKAS